jgi:mutual gliding-motility protein MglA
MSFINYSSKEINCKIVYYGPGLSGKTTQLKYIYDASEPDTRGKLIAVSDENSRTLFFDFLPMEMGNINGFKSRFHLYTVPGQIPYESSRKLILKGVDGVVFVADSQRERMDANKRSLAKLAEYLEDYGYSINNIPFVFAYNKRDINGVVPLNEISKELNSFSAPEFETVSVTGTGVFDVLKSITRSVLEELKGGRKI